MEKYKDVIEALSANRMNVYTAENREEAKAIALSLINNGNSVASGGSVTLDQCGILEAVKATGEYNYIDRYAPNVTPENRRAVFLESARCDVYLTSCNAITRTGELYNVDGNSNRVSAIAYGPEKVIAVVGVNKIVDTLEDAVLRVKTVAAPLNAKRLSCDTYCREAGRCVSCDGVMGAGCKSKGRICCNYLVSGFQRHPGRINIILVNEELGY